MTQICVYMKWDYHTYMMQPLPFLQKIALYMKKEYDATKRANGSKKRR